MALGLSLGMVSGYFGGLADKSVQCLVALFQGLPGTSLMIAIAAILPENDLRIIIALTLTSWTGFSRIVRNEVLAEDNGGRDKNGRCVKEPDSTLALFHRAPPFRTDGFSMPHRISTR